MPRKLPAATIQRSEALKVLGRAVLAREELQHATDQHWKGLELARSAGADSIAHKLSRFATARMQSAEREYEAANEACQRALAKALGVDPDVDADGLTVHLLAASVDTAKEQRRSS